MRGASAVYDAYGDVFRQLKIKMSTIKHSHVCEFALVVVETDRCRSVSGHKIGSVYFAGPAYIGGGWLNLSTQTTTNRCNQLDTGQTTGWKSRNEFE